MPVAETFTFRDDDGTSLSDISRLDTMVTVVDGFNFLHDYCSQDYIGDRGESLGEDDQRTVVNLLVEQVEFCDVIVLNKTDLLPPEDVARLEAILHTLNPRADIVHARFGQIPLERILNTGRFDFEQAAEAPGWLQELRGEHIPETEEYGISSFVYHARRPFHPARFYTWINQEWPGVIRSKGYFWLASRPGLVGSWSQAGPVTRHELGGLWWVAVPEAEWPHDEENRRIILERWVEPYGDAQQELVMIGIEMDEAALRQAFDACLLNDAELAAEDLWGLILSAPRNRALHDAANLPNRAEVQRFVTNGLRVFLKAYSTDPASDLAQLNALANGASPTEAMRETP